MSNDRVPEIENDQMTLTILTTIFLAQKFGGMEFFEDGTYQYWRKNDAGEWEAVTTREFQEYFVDGNFLATIWKNEGEDELREWWEIKSLKGDKMQWHALRANEDGSTFEQIMDWEKIEED